MPIVTFKYSIREDHGLNFSCYSVQISHCFFSTMQKNKAKIKLCSNFVSANYVTETQNGYSSFFLFLLCSFLIGKKSHSTNLPQFHLPPPEFYAHIFLSFLYQNWDHSNNPSPLLYLPIPCPRNLSESTNETSNRTLYVIDNI